MPFDPRVVNQRARDLIEVPAELRSVEYKRDIDFSSVQYRIAKTAMAMANLRDGGTIIVGISQDGERRFSRDGMSATNEASFIQEAVYEFVNRYASPAVELRVLPLQNGALRFVILDVQPFERTPVVCRRNTPNDVRGNDQMRAGDFFVRSGSPVSTQRVHSDAMMQEVLEIAVVRRLAEFQRMQRTAAADGAQNIFDAELGDLGDL